MSAVKPIDINIYNPKDGEAKIFCTTLDFPGI